MAPTRIAWRAINVLFGLASHFYSSRAEQWRRTTLTSETEQKPTFFGRWYLKVSNRGGDSLKEMAAGGRRGEAARPQSPRDTRGRFRLGLQERNPQASTLRALP